MPPGVRARVRDGDMAGDMTQDAVDCAAEAVAQFTAHTDVARFIKIEFDHKYGAPWHVIVGHHFASYISFEPQCFVYFFIEDLGILLFKSTR
jgi:dynein light chain LC8-type